MERRVGTRRASPELSLNFGVGRLKNCGKRCGHKILSQCSCWDWEWEEAFSMERLSDHTARILRLAAEAPKQMLGLTIGLGPECCCGTLWVFSQSLGALNSKGSWIDPPGSIAGDERRGRACTLPSEARKAQVTGTRGVNADQRVPGSA